MADTSSNEGCRSYKASERRGAFDELSSVVDHDEDECMKPYSSGHGTNNNTEDWEMDEQRRRLTIIGHTLALFPSEYSGRFSIPRISTFSGGIFNSSYVSRNAVVVIDSSSYFIRPALH